MRAHISRSPAAGGASRVHPALLVGALVLLAVNLRTTVASLPPLLGAIERELGLSGVAAGLLTAVPVGCMALFAPVAHRLAHRFGREATALAAVAVVALGNGLRVWGGQAVVLFAATFVAAWALPSPGWCCRAWSRSCLRLGRAP